MKLKTLAAAVAAMFPWGHSGPIQRGRHATFDAYDASAFPFRMGAGFPGDVNRTHPASVEPNLICTSNPPLGYGYPVIINDTADAANGPGGVASGGVRGFIAGDTAVTNAWGFIARPYPAQQRGTIADMGATTFGAATPPTTGEIDVLRFGYIMVQLNDITQKPVKGDPVFVWCAATSTIHLQGGIETAATGGDTAALDVNRYAFAGGPDANGVAEVYVR